MFRLTDYSLTNEAEHGAAMKSETIGQIVGSLLGAALIIAGMAVFGARISSLQERAVGTSVALHFADTVNVQGKAD